MASKRRGGLRPIDTTRSARLGLVAAGLVLGVCVAVAAANAGDLDTSFSSDGKRVQNFGATGDLGNAVAVDSHNRVVVAGWSFQPGGSLNYDFAVARFNTDGSLDTSFSGDGKRLQSFGNAFESDQATAVAVDSQDRIVVAGTSDQDTTNAVNNDFAIARYTTSGALDTSFSSDGKRVQNFAAAPSSDTASAVSVDAGNRVVVAGASDQSDAGLGQDFAIARYTASGALDTSFSSDGKRLQNFVSGDNADRANALAIDSQGRIVAAGLSDQDPVVSPLGVNEDFAIARYTTSGALDTSFSSDGKRVQNFITGDNNDVAKAVAIDSQNRVVAAGFSDQDTSIGTDFDFALARFTTGGGLDASFSDDGKKEGNLFAGGSDAEEIRGVAVDSQGRIVAAGYSDVDPSASTNDDFAIARLDAAGTLDPAFSDDGKLLLNFDDGTAIDQANGVAIDSQNRVVVAGQAFPATSDFGIARILGS